MPITSRIFDDVAEIVTVDRFSAAEKAGLLPGDIMLAAGDYLPSDVVGDPELLNRLGREDWMLLIRKGIVFKLSTPKGAGGCIVEASAGLDGVKVPDEESWEVYNVGLQLGRGILLLPTELSILWSLCPVILYARYRLWQMLTVTVLFYSVGAAYDLWLLAVTYAASSIIAALGGPKLLSDAAGAQGFQSRGRVAVTGYRDAASLEANTATLYRLERENAMHKTQKIEKMYGRLG